MAISQIDIEKCVGCGTCVNTCSMDVIRLNTPLDEKHDLTPCQSSCPAKVDIRTYVRLLTEGKMHEAIRVIRESLPLPAITGHVCFHPCEEGCGRGEVDAPVNINGLERYVADRFIDDRPEPAPRLHNQKVAVVGSGPAGIAAAHDLVKKGFPVTVFESQPKPGGMLRYGIPEYRLPEHILDAQIRYIHDLGADFRTNVALGKDLTFDELENQDYRAVLLALGAQKSRKLDIEGADLDQVLWGLDFLRMVKMGKHGPVGKRVVVIGGGNVAMDVALTVLRLGAREVRVFCLECRDEMPAHKEVIEMAAAEGIRVETSWGPRRIIGRNGRVAEIELVRCCSVFDRAGAFNPDFDEETSQTVEADAVVLAIGEGTDLSGLPEKIRTDKGHILADPDTLATSLPGTFAAGVVVYGPGSVVEAIAAGKKAAVSIERYLLGKANSKIEAAQLPVVQPPREGVEPKPRQESPLLPADLRKNGFDEIKARLSPEAFEYETKRCMACGSRASIRYLDDCMTCYNCERDCPEQAIFVAPGHLLSRTACWG